MFDKLFSGDILTLIVTPTVTADRLTNNDILYLWLKSKYLDLSHYPNIFIIQILSYIYHINTYIQNFIFG
jgi:hypothetical protein